MKTHKIQADVAALGTVIAALDPLEEHKRLWVLQTAASRFSLTINPSSTGGGSPDKGTDPALGLGSDKPATGTEMTPQAFIRAKDPTTDVQRIACLAY